MPTSHPRLVGVAFICTLSLTGSTLPAFGATGSAPSVVQPAIALSVTAPMASDPTIPTPVQPSYEAQVLTLINQARSKKRKCGSKTYAKAKPLTWNDKLAQAADRHSADMANHDYFSHTGRDGKSAGTRIKATGYRYKAMGETLAAGYDTPAGVVKAWLKSTPHCKILMSKSYTQLGVGYNVGPGKYTDYIAASFAKPKK